jgi:hypothetical protein
MMIRRKNFTRMLLAGGLLLPIAPFAAAQPPRTINPGTQPGVRQGNDLPGRLDANRPTNGQAYGNSILRGSQIIGATVNLRGGSRLGTIQDIVFSDGGCVDCVVAAYGDQFIPIPWAAAMYQPDQRVFMVDIDPGRIHDMPMFHQVSELLNHQFSDRVHTFYRGVSTQTGDMNRRGAVGRQGTNTNTQPATRGDQGRSNPRPAQNAPGAPAGRTERGGDHR